MAQLPAWREYPRPKACSYAEIRKLRNATVVINFPHGLGDWVMFNSVVSVLNCNNNRLYITRFGDDYVSLQAGSTKLRPIYTGLSDVHCNDGADYQRHHFHFHIPNASLKVTAAMAEKLREINCTHICFDSFPEVVGNNVGFPFHSKPRNVLSAFKHELTATEQSILERPLESAINTAANPVITEFVLAQLRNFTPYTAKTKLVLITRYGLTSVGKNWGHLFRSDKYPHEGDECREFIALCRRKNPNIVFVSIEHPGVTGVNSLIDHQNNVFGFHELFGRDASSLFFAPFAATLLSLMRIADIHVGCPTGASGVATLFPNLLNVLVWIELFPSWYFEPADNTTNVISTNALDFRRQQIGSFDEMSDLRYQNLYTDTANVTGETVFNLIESAL